MKTIHLIFFCFVCFVKGFSQTIPPNYYGQLEVEFTKDTKPKIFFASITNKPAFPDEDSAWIKAIENNINESIRDSKKVKKGKYNVTVKFIVAKDGNLSDIGCVTDPGFGMCEEVIRVLKKFKKLVPTEQRGKEVRKYRKG